MVGPLLITGGCGFIGLACLKLFLEKYPATPIRILDDLSVGSEEALAAVTRFRKVDAVSASENWSGVELLVGDIRESASSRAACRCVSAVVHRAANTGVGPSVDDPRADMSVNVC